MSIFSKIANGEIPSYKCAEDERFYVLTLFAIAKELGVPVKFAGVGEGIDDLRPFDARSYVEAII